MAIDVTHRACPKGSGQGAFKLISNKVTEVFKYLVVATRSIHSIG